MFSAVRKVVSRNENSGRSHRIEYAYEGFLRDPGLKPPGAGKKQRPGKRKAQRDNIGPGAVKVKT